MKTDPYEIVPLLLQQMPERVSNADGTVTYLCRLQQGILYHDDPCFPNGRGREVVAADVQFAFQRLCDPALASPIFGTLAEYVAGMNEAAEAAKTKGRFDYDQMKVRGIELVDAHSFKIHLLKPYPQILYWLAMHFTTPVAREAVEYYDGKEHPDGPNGKSVVRPLFSFHPVGNGPFKIVEWVRGQRFRFIRNESYRTAVFPSDGWPPEREAVNRPLAGHSLPLVDEVQMTIFREILPIWLLGRQGYLDRVGVMKDAVNTAITASRELTPKYAARGMKLERALEVSTFFLVLNMAVRSDFAKQIARIFSSAALFGRFEQGAPTAEREIDSRLEELIGNQFGFKRIRMVRVKRGDSGFSQFARCHNADGASAFFRDFTKISQRLAFCRHECSASRASPDRGGNAGRSTIPT